MSLIACSECGKSISSSALSCPHCGMPSSISTKSDINEEDVEYLCCPKCSSKELHSQHKGFSGGKALAGAIVAGGIGILAGTIGSKDLLISCMKCGTQFKAGEAKIIKTGSAAKRIETRVIELLCEGKSIEAESYYIKQTNSSVKDAQSYVYKLLSDGKVQPTEEQKAARRQEYENLKNKKGCLGVIILLLVPIWFWYFIF